MGIIVDIIAGEKDPRQRNVSVFLRVLILYGQQDKFILFMGTIRNVYARLAR
jgi:hypothetical protein